MASVGIAMEKPKCDAMVISEMKIKDEKVEKANEHIIIGGENDRPKRLNIVEYPDPILRAKNKRVTAVR